MAKRAPEQRCHRLAEELAGKIPERHVDAGQHLQVRPPLREGVEHVVVVDAEGERVLADQGEVRQAAAARGMQLDDGAHEVAVIVPALAIAGNAGIGIHPHEAEAVVEPHCLDAGDGDRAARSRRRCCKLRKSIRHRWSPGKHPSCSGLDSRQRQNLAHPGRREVRITQHAGVISEAKEFGEV